jgi:hypothetical protein
VKRRPGPAWSDQEAARARRIREIGCLACHLEGLGRRPTQIHHLTETGRHGGRRRGHAQTVGLCPWHHQGHPLEGLTASETALRLGPSLAHQPRAFRERYGRDDDLLTAQELALAVALDGLESAPF